ncbi:MAG TPA: Rieske 2Fe-2S domain-containing protein [Tepidisphaeraceae bacterium]|nr:Rieske 2Fe-2S domain-containing protein [Tepidisphaeraceae bacterium]
MADTHTIVTKVWIAPGCIVCDACENDCPEVFDVQEETCLIRPPAQKPDFLNPLTPSIITAAEGCPVDVIKFETKEVPGEAPWANQPAAAPAAAGGEVQAKAPAVKAAAPLGPPDPKWQALLKNSQISPSLSAGLASTIRRSPQVNQADEIIKAVALPKNAPPDQRMAMLAVGGAYQPSTSMADRLRQAASKTGQMTRRQMNIMLAVAWGAMAIVTMTFGAMFQDFFGPKVLKEPKSVYRVGRLDEFALPGVYEQYKPNGIWLVNLSPGEKRLVALSTTCTHLGCIPNWLASENKFKCPCHGSGYHMDGVNFEGPTPRPLERYTISRDADGYIVVDKRKVYRSELGEWDAPESFIPLA